MPAPPETFMAWTSRWVLQLFAGVALALFIIAAVGSLVVRIDWNQLTQPFVSLAVMIGVLYWLTTLLPGPIKKVGRAVGRQVAKAARGSTKRH